MVEAPLAKRTEAPGRRDAKSPLWEFVTLIAGALCLPLFSLLWSRFFRSGPDVRGFLLLSPLACFVALIAAGTLSGDPARLLTRVLGALRVATRWRSRLAAGLSVTALLWGVVVWVGLPGFSAKAGRRGLFLADQGHLAGAKTELTRAIDLDEGNLEAHYNLASLLEDLFQFDEAAHHYQIAFSGGLKAAANNLARLLIKQGRLDEATALLAPLYAGDASGADSLGPDLRVSVRKNFAWARLLQRREREARKIAEEAISLNPDLAVPHCILGETLERLGDSEGSLREWERCLALATVLEPDEDAWISAARDFIRDREENDEC